MQINISTRHGRVSEQTQEKVRQKLEKLSRFFDRLSTIELTINLEHRDNPVVDLKVSAEHKHDFCATCQAEELMAAVDKLIDKMEQQLRKYKEKVQDRHRATGMRQQAASSEAELES